MSEESLNLVKKLRLARQRANRERNRTKCRKYYRNQNFKTINTTIEREIKDAIAFDLFGTSYLASLDAIRKYHY